MTPTLQEPVRGVDYAVGVREIPFGCLPACVWTARRESMPAVWVSGGHDPECPFNLVRHTRTLAEIRRTPARRAERTAA